MQQPDPYLRYASSSYPMTGWLLIERALCQCEGTCECEWDEHENQEEDEE